MTWVSSCVEGDAGFGRVLRMPWRGRFMCPFAVAVLGLRYLRINVSDKCGHPLRNPRRTALRRVEILGLQRDWWVNLTALARVRTECVNVANARGGACSELEEPRMCGARSKQRPGHGRTWGPGVVHTPFGMGKVHKSVEGSLNPRKITCPLYRTSHFMSSKTTLHPALHRGRIPMRDATVNDGTMCPVRTVGRPGIAMSQICEDWTCLPSGKLICSGLVATRLLTTSTPSMMKMDVAPVSAIA